MKRVFLFLIVCFALISSALAEGSIDVDSGGGDMGSGSGSSYWNPGWDGVRVTIVDTSGNQICSPIDLTNKSVSGSVYHFGKHSKLYYKQTLSLSFNSNDYTCINPVDDLNTIVNTSGGNNIDDIKTYFTDTGHLQEIAGYVGMDYNDLVSGDYKIILEPIAYFKYSGREYAMTATEAALFDIAVDHKLYTAMRSLTHQNLPLSMYLEKTDSKLKLTKWSGETTGYQSNNNIIKYLGVGIVSFTGEDDTETVVDTDYSYHTDTDVITAISIPSDEEIPPDDPETVTFTIDGESYTADYICPEGESQLVWVKWHTPDTAQELTIKVKCKAVGFSASITCHITKLTEVMPPDTDYVEGLLKIDAAVPDFGSNTSTSWGQWSAEWHSDLVTYDDGDTFDEGWWDWDYNTYTASLKVDYELTPDSRVKTYFEDGDDYEMKSGYGVNILCKTVVSVSDDVSTSDYTQVQNINAVFPEFKYTTYNRLLEYTTKVHGYYRWELTVTPYSYYDSRVHFTPLNFPDETDYVVPLDVMDAWTPGGELYATVSDFITIDGDMYDDGYIRILK